MRCNYCHRIFAFYHLDMFSSVSFFRIVYDANAWKILWRYEWCLRVWAASFPCAFGLFVASSSKLDESQWEILDRARRKIKFWKKNSRRLLFCTSMFCSSWSLWRTFQVHMCNVLQRNEWTEWVHCNQLTTFHFYPCTIYIIGLVYCPISSVLVNSSRSIVTTVTNAHKSRFHAVHKKYPLKLSVFRHHSLALIVLSIAILKLPDWKSRRTTTLLCCKRIQIERQLVECAEFSVHWQFFRVYAESCFNAYMPMPR